MSDVVAKLAAVMEDVQAVAKKDRNDHQKFMFRGIDAVVNAVGPALRTHGVVVVPHVDEVQYDRVETSTKKPATACRVVVTYTFWHGDSSLPCTVAAEAWDHGDKAAPKAMSVAFRTALLQALTLPTDEPDPDSHSYEQAVKPSQSTEKSSQSDTKASRAMTSSPKRIIADRLKAAGVDPQTFVDWLDSTYSVKRLDDLKDEARFEVIDAVTKGNLLDQLKDAA